MELKEEREREEKRWIVFSVVANEQPATCSNPKRSFVTAGDDSMVGVCKLTKGADSIVDSQKKLKRMYVGST